MATKRKISFAVHLAFIGIPLVMATISAFTWWSRAFGDPLIASALIATLEILGITSLILVIRRIPWPLAWTRRIIPAFSALPLGYELYTYLEPNVHNPGAWGIALIITLWFTWLEFTLLQSFEGLFISRVEAMEEATRVRMESLAVSLQEWRTASHAVQQFAYSVVAQPQQLPPQPTMPQLLPGPSAHPKMLQIAQAARLRNADGTWLLSLDDIVRETRVERSVAQTIVTLVRSGQLTLQEVDNG